MVYTPLSSRNRLIWPMVSFIGLNGDSGSIVSRLFTSSRMPNSPMLRCSPTLGWRSAIRSWWVRSTSPIRFALPTRSSSSITSITAIAAAIDIGWEL